MIENGNHYMVHSQNLQMGSLDIAKIAKKSDKNGEINVVRPDKATNSVSRDVFWCK